MAGGEYTSPLGLVSAGSRWRASLLPVLDLVVIALLVSLVFTRFVILPGVRVDLPATELRMQYAASVAFLTVQNQDALQRGVLP